MSGGQLWQPDASSVANSQLTAFTHWLSESRGEVFSDYEQLHRWSVTDPSAFWQSYWQFSELRGSGFEGTGVEHLDRFPGAKCFPQARLNYAENLLAETSDRTALVSIMENGQRREVTYQALHA